MNRTILAICLATGVSTGLAQAATITGGETTVTVTADLGGLGLGATPFGSASAEGADFTFPITGGTEADDDSLEILHEGSGVTLFTLDEDEDSAATVGNFVIDTAAAAVFGDLIGGPEGLELFTFGEAETGIGLDISSTLAGALTDVFAAPDLTGARFGVAATSPSVSPVPLPASAALLLAGIGGLAVARRRRGAA